MSRYIDAEAFLKEYCEPYPHVYMAMSKAVADAPSIDIVRCKECRHWRSDGGAMMLCEISQAFTMDNDYCSWGEREGE